MHEKIALAAFDCMDVTWTYTYCFTDHLQMYADSHIFLGLDMHVQV